jgi:hypothetical protein
MSTIVTRADKGSPLTNAEVDANFTNLNTDKYQEGSAIGAVTPAAGTFTTLTATGQTSLGGAAGSESLRALANAGQNGYVEVKGGIYGTSSPAIVARNAGAGSGFNIANGNQGTISFYTNDLTGQTPQLRVAHTASAVNYVQVTGAATGGSPTISAQGSDSNPNITLQSKGTGNVVLMDGGGNTGVRLLRAVASGDTFVDVQRLVGGVSFTAASSVTNGALVFQSKGTGAIDLAAGSRGVNISNGGTVTAITTTGAGSGYTSAPTVALTAPTTAGGVQATASAVMGGTGTITVTNGGSGYTVNDVLTFVGGTGSAESVTVTAVSAGVITAVTFRFTGQYTVVPANPVSVTGGTGTGATFTCTWKVLSLSITNAGSGYVEQPTVTFSGGGGSGAAAYATVGSYTTIKSIGTGTGKVTNQAFTFETPNSITSGNPVFIIRDSASHDSWYQMGPSSSQAFLVAKGNANASAYLGASGSGSIRFTTNGDSITEQLRVSHTASAVNYVQVTGGATGSGTGPSFSAAGSDAAIPLTFTTKSTGAHRFVTGAGLAVSFVDSGGTTANYLQVQGRQAGNGPIISSQGTDTNIDLNLNPKGTGTVVANGPLTATGQTSLGGAAGSEGLRVLTTSSAVQRVVAKGNVSGSSGVYVGAASDVNTDVAMIIGSQGTSSIRFTTARAADTTLGADQLRVSHTASAVNYVQVTGAATGSFPTVSAQGSDANVPLILASKGTSPVLVYGGGNRQLRIDGATTGANHFNISAAATGQAPFIQVADQSTDTNVAFALRTKGTGAIDLAAGSSGVNISNGGTVTALTRTNAGIAYTSFPSIAISAPTTSGGVQATASVASMTFYGSTPTVNSGGTGYTVGDVLTVASGAVGGSCTLTVTSVSAGVITAATHTAFGSLTTLPSVPYSVTGGTGTGATFTSTWQVANQTITNAGSGYVEQPTVTFSGGGGSGAAAYAVVGSGTTVKSIGSTMSFSTAGGEQFRVVDNAGATQYISAIGSSTGNVAFNFSGSGTGGFSYVANSGSHRFWSSGSTEQLRVSHTASAVNYVQVTGAATGGRPTISAQGSDTNLGFGFQSKGTFGFTFLNSSNGTIASISHAGSSTPNSIALQATISGSSPTLSSQGSDTNIDLTLTPKGTGNVRFGTYTGTALSIAGYIEIKDAGGTIRKLAVVA